jgi:hypothetical protein
MEQNNITTAFFKYKDKYYETNKVFIHDHHLKEKQSDDKNIKTYDSYADLFAVYENGSVSLSLLTEELQSENHGEIKRKISTIEALVAFVYTHKPDSIIEYSRMMGTFFSDHVGNFLKETTKEEIKTLVYPEKYVPANHPNLSFNSFLHKHPYWHDNNYADFEKVNPILFTFMKETGRLDPNRDWVKVHQFLKNHWDKDLPRLWNK